jgi:hypothetical protein
LKNFNHYKKVIIISAHMSWHQDLISTWESTVFPQGVCTTTTTDPDGEENPDSPHKVHCAAHESEITEVLHCIQLDSGGDGSLNMDPDSVPSVSNSIIDSNRDTDKDLEYVDSHPLTPCPVEPRPGNGNMLAFQDSPCPLQRTFAFSLPATPVAEASSPAAEVQNLTFSQDHPHLVTKPVVAPRKPVQRGHGKKVP